MEFRILGPIEVRAGDTVAVVRGRHHPKLLVMLLLAAGRAVSVDRLTEALWDGEPPATARRQVRNAVASLRRWLAGVGADPIEVAGDSVRLTIDPRAVDANRFTDLLSRGRHAARDGRHAEAVSLLDQALAQWREPVPVELPGRLFAAAMARLAESRLDAEEERARARLALGEAGLAGQLRQVLSRHPHRQRTAALLMRALAAEGQVTAAADVYTRLRDRLAAELGIDPGPELREEYARVSGAGPALEAATPAPAQLPAAVASFTGRDEQLAQLDKLVDRGDPVAVLSAIAGAGGVGKTALALHWGQRHRDRFPDGQLYINLRGFDHGEPVAPQEAVPRFLRALGVPGPNIPANVDEAAALYRSIMSGRRMLVVLDNAAGAEQVRPLLCGGSGTLTIVTSRNSLTGLVAIDDAKPIDLDVLSMDESLELLSRLLGAERVAAEPGPARRLARLCGRLPLALRIAAANLTTEDRDRIDGYLTELDGAARLDRLEIDGDSRSSVTGTFDLSFRALPDAAQDLFLRLALVPGEDLPEALAVALAGETGGTALLRRLVTGHLLESSVPGRYRFHDLVRLYAKEKARQRWGDPADSATMDAVITWYFDNRRGLRYDDAGNVLALCDAGRDHPRLWQAVESLITFVNAGHRLPEARRRAELALRIAETAGDAAARARALNMIASTHSSGGDGERGVEFARAAAAAAAESGNPALQAVCDTNLALGLYRTGAMREARGLLLGAVRVAREQDNLTGLVIRLGNLGGVYRALGEYRRAEECFFEVLRLNPVRGTGADQAVSLARLYLDMGEPGKAKAALEQRLPEIETEPGSRIHVSALMALGAANWELGDAATGRRQLLESVEYANSGKLPQLERECLRWLAECETDAGDHAAASRYLDTLARIPVPAGALSVHAELARTRCKVEGRLGDFAAALDWGEKSREHYLRVDYPLHLARTLKSLAVAREGLGDASAAASHRREALAIFARLGVPEADVLRDLLSATAD